MYIVPFKYFCGAFIYLKNFGTRMERIWIICINIEKCCQISICIVCKNVYTSTTEMKKVGSEKEIVVNNVFLDNKIKSMNQYFLIFTSFSATSTILNIYGMLEKIIDTFWQISIIGKLTKDTINNSKHTYSNKQLSLFFMSWNIHTK